MPKVSVIIPCYNVEKYIERCLDSVQRQLLEDIEIICVDDKSSDNTLNILKSRTKQDSRIRIIEQDKNMGVAIARNTAIDAAQGEYIGFVDADDYIDLDFFEKLYNGAKRDEADIAKGLFVVIEMDGRRWITPYSNEARVRKTRFNYDFQSAIYKKSFLDKYNLRFPQGVVLAEDVCFLFKAVYLCNKIHVSSYTSAYYYPLRLDSASNNTISHKKIDSVITITRELLDWMNTISDMPAEDHNQLISLLCSILIKNINKADASDIKLIENTLFEVCDKSREPDASKTLMCNIFVNLCWTLPQNYIPGNKLLQTMRKYAPDAYKTLTKKTVSCHGIANGLIKVYVSYTHARFKLFDVIPCYKTSKNKVLSFATEKEVKTSQDAPKISVIVPVYNVEKYIRGCIESLINQTIQDIEIICVDDCGTDKSMQIIDEYAQRDKRIKIFHNKKNSGVSATYNTGLEKATAKYIMFCDSDDMLEPSICEKLYNRISGTNSDIAVCGVNIIYEADEHLKENDQQYFAILNDNILTAPGPIQEMCYPCTWGKIYKREIIEKHEIRFPEGMKREDEFFFRAYCTWVRKAAFIPEKLYNYRRRAGSIMNNAGKEKLDTNYIMIAIELFKYLTKHNMLELQKDWFWGCVFYGFVHSSVRDTSPSNHKICFKLVRKFIKRHYTPYGVSPDTNAKIMSLKNKK